jgi:hypothetical protein
VLLDDALEFGVDNNFAAEGGGNSLDRDVIVGGTDAARRHDELEGLGTVCDFCRDGRDFVGDDGDPIEGDAEFAQLARGKIGVAILHLTGQDFVAHNHHRTGSLGHQKMSPDQSIPNSSLCPQAAARGKVVSGSGEGTLSSLSVHKGLVCMNSR